MAQSQPHIKAGQSSGTQPSSKADKVAKLDRFAVYESLRQTTGIDFANDKAARRQLALLLAPELVHEQRLLVRQLEIDQLTGVANRAALDKAEPRAKADPEMVFIAFDANNFGLINKAAGQEAGDEALKQVAQAISEAAAKFGFGERVFRYQDQVFRRGGDEFVVIAHMSVAPDILAEAERLFGEMHYPNFTVSLTGTIGPTFQEADNLLQAAKQKRKNQD